MASSLTWREAALKVLQDAGAELHFTDIADRIIEGGLKETIGATPAATVGAALYTWAKEPAAPVEQVGKGVFRVRPGHAATGPGPGEVRAGGADTPPEGLLDDGGLVRAFGMFWHRGQVIWDGKGQLLGQQRTEANPVDFAGQKGVYLLHDRDRVVYVGRALDTLFARLRAHTRDRLSGRWDRFSWFGLLGVDPETGALAGWVERSSPPLVLETLESILIECLEPPLNRRRGDGLEALEYVQVEDPEIGRRRNKALLDAIASKAGL